MNNTINFEDEESTSIGERIKLVRQSNKKSQKEFAEEFGLSQSHISNIEKGNDKPSLTLIKFICLKYDVSEEWLMHDEGYMERYGNWDYTDDGLYAKYATFKKDAEDLINRLSGEDRKNFVAAYCYFVTLATGNNLEGEKKSQYIRLLNDFMDKFERLIFATSSYKSFSQSSKVNYHCLFDYVNTSYQLMSEMDKSLKETLNMYLSSYDLPFSF